MRQPVGQDVFTLLLKYLGVKQLQPAFQQPCRAYFSPQSTWGDAMGAWGTGILEDDLAVDIYGGYMERYDEGQHTGDIRCTSKDHQEDAERLGLAVVGQTALRSTDPTADPAGTGVGFSSWGWIENQIWLQDDWDKGVRKPVRRP